jgi:hypothetical protein
LVFGVTDSFLNPDARSSEFATFGLKLTGTSLLRNHLVIINILFNSQPKAYSAGEIAYAFG